MHLHKIFYALNKNGNYTGAVYSDNQPDASTEIQPVKPYVDSSGNAVEGITVGMTNPKWDGAKWAEQIDPIKPSVSQQLLMQQSQQLVVLQSITMQQNQENAKLQSANQQQATQIQQLQQTLITTNQQQSVDKKEGSQQ
ncbi:hypothetical protein [Lactiplantibacillus plantarum]|uniref:hypothetical protein n=1 Tax=Lactiplantibacillus plantarum TaxID=1590 RepID=UPI00076169CC|nr:hypothetical protein [Lactiplantibacillus plantarum]